MIHFLPLLPTFVSLLPNLIHVNTNKQIKRPDTLLGHRRDRDT